MLWRWPLDPIYCYVKYKTQGKNNGNSILQKHLSIKMRNNRKENYFNDVRVSKEITSAYTITTRHTAVPKRLNNEVRKIKVKLPFLIISETIPNNHRWKSSL